MPRKIKQPKSKKVSAVIRQQRVEVNLAWNKTFGQDQTARFDNAQKFVDSECIRLMVKYTPARNNILYKSPTLGTKIGSGHIYYSSPYARYQYYGKLMVSRLTGSPYASKGESKVLTDKNLRYDTFRHPQAQKLWLSTLSKQYVEYLKAFRKYQRYAMKFTLTSQTPNRLPTVWLPQVTALSKKIFSAIRHGSIHLCYTRLFRV